MPQKESSYKHFRLKCLVCDSDIHCRLMPIDRPATLLISCPTCRADVVAAVAPDQSLDGTNQQNGYHCVPLLDLIYLESGLTEEEGDRLLWGNKHTMERRIEDYRRSISTQVGLRASDVGDYTGA